MIHPDPFVNTDPLWQPFELPTDEPELGWIDNPAYDLNEFLRAEIAARRPKHPEPPPKRSPILGHIPGYPD
jgi:hypothetical protein